VVIEEGVAETAILVMVGGGRVMVTVAVPDFVASWVDVALMVSAPEEGTVEGAV
jgi:hypothetical protein